MEFAEPSEAVQLKKAIDDFIEREVEPLERKHEEYLGADYEKHIVDEDHYQVDEYRDIMETIRKKSVEAGYYGMTMPEDVGGGGIDVLTRSIVGEHVANRGPGFHGGIFGGAGGPTPILLELDEDQREKYLYPVMEGEKTTCFALTEPEHGSDPQYMNATAEKDGDEWVINANKYWISNGPYADFAMVFARTSGEDGEYDGITCFLVDRDNPGFEVERVHRTMGLTPGAQAELRFDDLRIPESRRLGEEGDGFVHALKTLNGGRITIAARGVGIARAAFEEARDYAGEREQFGQPIGEFQSIKHKLADMDTKIQAAKMLMHKAADKKIRGEDYIKDASQAKLYASEVSREVANEGIQIHGGYGYTKDFAAQRFYRDAKLNEIYEGTSEVLRNTIGDQLLEE